MQRIQLKSLEQVVKETIIFYPLLNTSAGNKDQEFIDDFNKAIDCINHFRFNRVKVLNDARLELKQALRMLKEGGDNNVEALQKINRLNKKVAEYMRRIVGDINARHEFIEKLKDEKQRAALRASLKAADQQERRAKLAQLNAVFASFDAYRRFAHLTAEELAAVAMMIDILIIGITNVAFDFSDSNPHVALEKVAELEEARKEIAACMRKHLEKPTSKLEMDGSYVLLPENNKPAGLSDSALQHSNIEDLFGSAVLPPQVDFDAPRSDILFALRDQINAIVGEDVLTFSPMLDKDASQHLPLPKNPISMTAKSKSGLTVGGFFNNYTNADAEKQLTHNTWVSSFYDYLIQPVTNMVSIALSHAFGLASSLQNFVIGSNREINDMLSDIKTMQTEVHPPKKPIAPPVVEFQAPLFSSEISAITEAEEITAVNEDSPPPISTVALDVSTGTLEESTTVEAPDLITPVVTVTTVYPQPVAESQSPSLSAVNSTSSTLDQSCGLTAAQETVDSLLNTDSSSERLEAWKKTLRQMKVELETDIKSLKRSCFASFWSSKCSIKQAKSDALTCLLSSASFADMQVRAKSEMKKPDVIAGISSKTKTVLQAIINAKDPSVQHDGPTDSPEAWVRMMR